MVPCQRLGVACASYRHRVVSRRYKVVCQHHDAIGRHRNCRVADALACIPRPAVLLARCLQHSRTQNRTEHTYSTDEQPVTVTDNNYRQLHAYIPHSQTPIQRQSMVPWCTSPSCSLSFFFSTFLLSLPFITMNLLCCHC